MTYCLFTDINECNSHPCMHGATCQEEIAVYNCTCIDGYTGYNCETGRY